MNTLGKAIYIGSKLSITQASLSAQAINKRDSSAISLDLHLKVIIFPWLILVYIAPF